MQLLHDFFHIEHLETTATGLVAVVRLNPEHIVYTGHFPGFPVTPGVIQMQMVAELLEQHLGEKVVLSTMPQCKFLHVLNPDHNRRLTLRIQCQKENSFIQVQATGEQDNTVFFKFLALFSPISA